MLVSVYLSASSVHGIGLFAEADIPQGAEVWRFDPLIDRAMTAIELAALPACVRAFVSHHAYIEDDGRMILCGDQAAYFNHSERPNVRDGVAVVEISAGTELTEDYREFGSGACNEFLARTSRESEHG